MSEEAQFIVPPTERPLHVYCLSVSRITRLSRHLDAGTMRRPFGPVILLPRPGSLTVLLNAKLS